MLHKAITLLSFSSAALCAVIPRDIDHIKVPVLSDILHIGNDDAKNISLLNNNNILNTVEKDGNVDKRTIFDGDSDGDISHIHVPVLSDILHIGNDDVKNISALNNNNIGNSIGGQPITPEKRDLLGDDSDSDGDISHIYVPVLSDILHIGNDDVKNVSALDNNNILNTIAEPTRRDFIDDIESGASDGDDGGDISHIYVPVISDILHIGNDDVKNVSAANNNNILNSAAGEPVPIGAVKRDLLGGDDTDGDDISHIGVSVLSDILHIGNDDVKNISALNNNNILNTVAAPSQFTKKNNVRDDIYDDEDGDISHIAVSVLSDILHIGNDDVKNVSALNNNNILNTVGGADEVAKRDVVDEFGDEGDISHIGVSVLSDILHIGNDDIKNISALNNNSILNTASQNARRQLSGAVNSPAPTLPSNQSFTDTCSFVQAGSLANLLGGGNGATTGFSNSCLCVDNVAAFLASNPAAAAVAQVNGFTATENALEQLVINDPGAETCTFPAFSVPACTNDDPCSYVCVPGYELQGGDCVPASAPPTDCGNGYTLYGQNCSCPSPNCIYNGQCLPPA